MPRRPIRRPASTIDLDRYLRAVGQLPEQLPEQLSSRTLFDNDRPLEIEVGSGKGLFMSSVSGEFPNHNYLGIEIARKYAAHAAGRLAKVDPIAIKEGFNADFVVFETDAMTGFSLEFMRSKSGNTPFIDKTLNGQIRKVVRHDALLLDR